MRYVLTRRARNADSRSVRARAHARAPMGREKCTRGRPAGGDAISRANCHAHVCARRAIRNRKGKRENEKAKEWSQVY